MNHITNIQLFALIVIFEVGSTTLFALGIGAKQNAWVVVLCAYLCSLLLIWAYTQIPKYYPHKNFAFILDDTLGKALAKPLLLLFGLYFLNQTMHNFYEFGALINMTALPHTPLSFILYVFIIVIIYILILGIEVLTRSIEIVFPFFILVLIAIYFLNLLTGEFEWNNLQPILGNGITPVLKEVPNVLSFPFGEMIVFLTFWHFVKDPNSIRRTTYIAVSFSTLLLLTSLLVILAVLGPKLASHTEIPLLETLLSIHIGMIFTNLDSIGVFIMFIGGFFKTAIHFYGFCLAITWLLNKQKPNWIIVVAGLLLPVLSLMRFESLNDQRWKGIDEGIYNILIYSLIPVFLVILIAVKNWAKRKEK
ncbi:GerAB/ArcD/ProY family transporter [Gracilibacillus oryzae]|uniref:GerAB/ArcD/ProY family transporter n=1 Tax=Gracilibacillus oryzae TaxID=1672701 RepID=A0A7C8KQL7_9BACI|nr:GerAB/ArcD/ProY family transporter [Gracilibacillus oryzae]KAB8137546.1 GerAB/ArcD/ProY family transporter [Gracilibacillus oryzae]